MKGIFGPVAPSFRDARSDIILVGHINAKHNCILGVALETGRAKPVGVHLEQLVAPELDFLPLDNTCEKEELPVGAAELDVLVQLALDWSLTL